MQAEHAHPDTRMQPKQLIKGGNTARWQIETLQENTSTQSMETVEILHPEFEKVPKILLDHKIRSTEAINKIPNKIHELAVDEFSPSPPFPMKTLRLLKV